MIRKLPQAVVNQIAAGEVVERPASIVKELVENALDAGALRIRIEVDGGGAERIAVIDDGVGFLPEDLPLAFASHATSKLADVADLDHIATLGFRGEALASIGAVSRASIASRRRGAAEGWTLRCDGGAETSPRPCGGPEGTRVEVRDLFYNVPARRRFLKAPHAERARIQQLVGELALIRLDVDWTLCADQREVLRLPGGESLAERFQRCFGTEIGRGLLPVTRRFGDLAIEGVLGEPDLARRDSRLELMSVNGRAAQERSALQAVRQAYRDYLMGGRFPVYALHLVMPADQVDVNVHPRKAEVRFVQARRVAGCLHEVVREVLGGRRELAAEATGVVIDAALPRARSGFPNLPAGLFAPGPAARATPDAAPAVVRETGLQPAAAKVVRPNPFRAAGRFLQVLDVYLLLESDNGLVIVDQHALHERVVYERLKRWQRTEPGAVQRLLVPEVVDVTPVELAWFEAAQPSLAAEGLLVEPFGPTSVAVRGVPAVLTRVDARRLVRALAAAEFGDGRAAVREQIAERFHSIACRSSVMRGDRLQDDEIRALLAEAAALEHPHNCPHGRPTVLVFSAAELERYFRRSC